MIGNSADIDLSIANIWKSWYNFRKGKRNSPAIEEFEYYLERNISSLHTALNDGTYRHGGYEHFTVNDTKPRDIAVAAVRDRLVHRMLYDYLVPIWDKTFVYDVWSCRTGKGLHGAVDRAEGFLKRYPNAWVWRADIKKMFDSIDQPTMKHLLRRRVHDPNALFMLDEVINSYTASARKPYAPSLQVGLPIGNLTSQIMSNIYLNELDRLMKHQLKPFAYLRYGDDWLCFGETRQAVESIRVQAITFLSEELLLTVNPKINHIRPAYKGVSYLGVDIWAHGRRLQLKVQRRIKDRLNIHSAASYRSLVLAHEDPKKLKEIDWRLSDGEHRKSYAIGSIEFLLLLCWVLDCLSGLLSTGLVSVLALGLF